MTLPAFTTNRSGPFAADGANREWTYNFMIIEETDAQLEVYDAAGALEVIESADFTITGLGTNAGGTITYPIAPAAALATGVTVYVRRRVVVSQPYSFTNQGQFFPEMHEAAFDRTVSMLQDYVAGAYGARLLSGSGVPNNITLGAPGDFYINLATPSAPTIYGPKTGAGWGSATSLVGPPGDAEDLVASAVENDSGVVGASVADALNTLQTDKLEAENLVASAVENDSAAPGDDVADALDALYTDKYEALDDALFNSITAGTADAGNINEVYALSDEGNFDGIAHILSDDYNRLIRISRVSSTDGTHVPMDVALASRGTLDSPSPMQVGDRSWAIAAGGRAASGTWQRLGYQWYEVKSAPSGDIIPGMWVVRVTKPDDYFPRDILNADWTDGVRRFAHGGFDGIIDQSDAATIAWDVTQAQVAEVTLGGNRTLLPSGMKDGFEYDFYVSADGSARILSLSNSGGLEWYLRGSDGILYTQTSPLALPANGLAHIKMIYGGGAFIGTVTLITGQPQRAVSPSVQFTSLATNRAGANNNSAQAVFASTEDTLTVEGSTAYFFDALYSFTRAAGTTAHRTNVLFGGTATFTSIGYHAIASSTEADFGVGLPYAFGRHSNVATAFDIFGADTNDAAETVTVKLSGIMRINAAGTIIPQIQYSAAPGGAPTFLAGSYFRAWPVGNNNVVAVGDWN